MRRLRPRLPDRRRHPSHARREGQTRLKIPNRLVRKSPRTVKNNSEFFEFDVKVIGFCPKSGNPPLGTVNNSELAVNFFCHCPSLCAGSFSDWPDSSPAKPHETEVRVLTRLN